MLEAKVHGPFPLTFPSVIPVTSLRYSDYGETKAMAAVEFFRNVMQAMGSKHSRENIILKGLHRKKELGDISQPEKTWFVLAKEQVGRLCVTVDPSYPNEPSTNPFSIP